MDRKTRWSRCISSHLELVLDFGVSPDKLTEWSAPRPRTEEQFASVLVDEDQLKRLGRWAASPAPEGQTHSNRGHASNGPGVTTNRSRWTDLPRPINRSLAGNLRLTLEMVVTFNFSVPSPLEPHGCLVVQRPARSLLRPPALLPSPHAITPASNRPPRQLLLPSPGRLPNSWPLDRIALT